MTTMHSMETLTRPDNTPLALHSWIPREVDPVNNLFYIHGLQSHAGWLVETGPALARQGIATFALDRRGSGRSGGTPGDLPSPEIILDDYRAALARVGHRTGNSPLTLLGQSFGGSVLAAMAVEGLPESEQLIYCAPALNQQRHRHTLQQLDDIRQAGGSEYLPVGLVDEDYSDKSRYLEFMANDDLMLRQITERTRSSMVRIEDLYHGKRAGCRLPVRYVRPIRDAIIDLSVAENALAVLHDDFTTTVIEETNHFLEFSGSRRQYWDWLANSILLPAGHDGRLVSQ